MMGETIGSWSPEELDSFVALGRMNDVRNQVYNDMSKLVQIPAGMLPGDSVVWTGSTWGITRSATGRISAWAVVPSDWLVCNGAAVSRTTFSALFTAIGTTFGVGDGSTTFNVPTVADLAAGTIKYYIKT